MKFLDPLICRPVPSYSMVCMRLASVVHVEKMVAHAPAVLVELVDLKFDMLKPFCCSTGLVKHLVHGCVGMKVMKVCTMLDNAGHMVFPLFFNM